jgi:O-succinylbenzoic acid--CoA ligase
MMTNQASSIDSEQRQARLALTGGLWAGSELTALRIGTSVWSYAQLAEVTEQRAAQLRARGFLVGELILCPVQPLLESMLIHAAVTRLGGAILPVAADQTRDQRAELARVTGAEWFWEPQPCSSCGGRPVRTQLPRPVQRKGSGCPSTPALLMETSGSQGSPKIVMLSAGNMLASCLEVNARLQLAEGDRWLCVLPRQRVGGLAIGHRCALAGATLVVQERFDPLELHRALEHYAATHVSLVPAMLHRLLERRLRAPPELRAVLMGGQALEQNLARRAVALGWPLYAGYGMTETFTQVAGGWIDGSGRPGHGLQPLGGVELEAPPCDADQPAMAVFPSEGTLAAIRLRGPMTMLGYATPTRVCGVGLEHGWLTTNDLGCLTPEGALRVAGRTDDALVVAGINVAPCDAESRLSEFADLGEVAVVGIPDAAWGHRLVALYTGPADPAVIEQWCRRSLPSHLRPRGFARVEQLPQLTSGKRDRQAVARLAAQLFGDGN